MTSDAGQHGSGVLTKRLLTRHLWRDFDQEDHTVVLQLMKAFKLLRPVPLAEEETFLVPTTSSDASHVRGSLEKPSFRLHKQTASVAIVSTARKVLR
jgi:hypothetical protein